jgi:hypothetical protein
VIPNELLEYYESLTSNQDSAHLEENAHLRAYVVEIRDLWEKRVVLRELRYRAGMPVCSGGVDCLDDPTSQCMSGEHRTCPTHTDDCYLCIPTATLP